MAHGHIVALFDILGFEKRLARLGLYEMRSRYEALIDAVNYRKVQMQRVFSDLGLKEAPYWIADSDIYIFNKVHGAYASDSILLWSNRTWPKARESNHESYQELAGNPADGWNYHPVPSDNFLDVCNDLMCRGLEVGLPLRGAIAIGDAILEPDENIYLGQPIVDAARLENGHQLIGASFCKSGMKQIIPPRYTLQFDSHIKATHHKWWGGAMLDWPRHWRNSRQVDLHHAIQVLDTEPEHSTYYQNTLELIAHSSQYADRFESLDETSIRSQYSEFQWSNTKLELSALAVRRVPIE
ncbi:hypothetical protein ACMYR3_06770 [Ampullimonas aquatilis]|uniref:hypothetical protein n=1 Tax=Ampullimonas aquatilis TaxID=1341549 RepID=UPI003C764B03